MAQPFINVECIIHGEWRRWARAFNYWHLFVNKFLWVVGERIESVASFSFHLIVGCWLLLPWHCPLVDALEFRPRPINKLWTIRLRQNWAWAGQKLLSDLAIGRVAMEWNGMVMVWALVRLTSIRVPTNANCEFMWLWHVPPRWMRLILDDIESK